MANPNSLLTKTRIVLCRWLDPHPDAGKAWCVDCQLNDGRTVILNANGHREHVELHRDESGKKTATSICMRVNYGQVGVSNDDEEP